MGYVPEQKDDHTCRFVFENYNSLSFWNSQHKIHHLNKMLRQFDADCALGVELQVQWDMADTNLRLDKILMPGQQKRVAIGYNRHEKISRSQHGGTSIATFDRLSQFVQESGSDPHGLGRWSWMKVSSGSLTTIIMVAYLPCKSKASATATKQRRETVYNQQGRYFRALGDVRCPRAIFVDHIGQQLELWKQQGHQIILFADANSNIYDGILARELQRDEIRMNDVCEAVLGFKSPNSHASGTLPITGIFATAELTATSVFQSAHGYGLGDHRVFAVDIDLTQLLGPEYSQLVRLPGRKLQAKRYRIRKAYNKSLRDNIKRHRLTEKYHHLSQEHRTMTSEELQGQVNKLDSQKTEFMRCAESKCKKKCAGKLPCSPKVSYLFKRLRLFDRIRKHKVCPLKDPRNLHRKCRVLAKDCSEMEIKQPNDYTLPEIDARIITIQDQIKQLEPSTPELRFKHVRNRIDDALEKGNKKKAQELTNMLEREELRGCYREIKKTTNKGRGKKVFSVEQELPDGTRTTITSKDEIERVAGQTIGERYRLAYSAPIMSHNKLLADVGFSGDGSAVDSILRGEYQFPQGTDPYTELLLLEAAVLFSSLGEQGIEDWIYSHDFQQYWLHACERTESSKSQLHFGHYMAGAHDKSITELHVASLNTIREIGISPDRWRCSVTVLLEKVFGVRLITKLRAICLLEADFNWLNKLIFARRLEAHCRQHGLTPREQFAKSKSSCEEASLVKNLANDGGRILHNNSAVTSNDFDQCYDRGCAPISGIAARAHGVSKQTTTLMLQTMQNMDYFIKTGFGISESPTFGGGSGMGSKLMGLGQGSGAAPGGMRNIITLVDNAYKRLGHGMSAASCLSGRIFLLAAIIYVDDTDLLHWAKFYGIKDEDFVDQIQAATTDWGMLVQATGGAVKPSKSFWYLMSWKFHRGKAMLKSKEELSHFVMSIPQSNGTTATIPLEANHVTKKTLGVWNNPLNDPTVPLEKLRTKGLDWVDKLRIRPLERKHTWLSLTSQQYPALFYGLSSLYASPDELETVMGSVYFNALPFLGFNRNINKAYRTLPSDYQGIGLKNWSIEKISKDTAVLLRHWQSDSTLGLALEFVYEAFLMEVGLDGNVLTRSYDKLQHLATHSWFKILWQYCCKYDLSVTFAPRFNLHPIREGDIALMEIFLQYEYSKAAVETLNRCRRFYCVHSLADVLRADGTTIDSEKFKHNPGTSNRLFSWEIPTKTDLQLWDRTLLDVVPSVITSRGKLGKYVRKPHREYEWFAAIDEDFVYRTLPTGGYDIYRRDNAQRTTRSGQKYTKISSQPGNLPVPTLYASVTTITSTTANLHSTCSQYYPATNPSTFLECINSHSNQSLWDNLEVDGDGDWLIKSILQNTLVVCMDGSYMPDLSRDVCSGAFILRCTDTEQEVKGCLVDKSHQADNYRGEMLGAIGSLLILRTAIEANPQADCSRVCLQLHCDNKGVISHGNQLYTALKVDQVQADLIRLMKTYARQLLPIQVDWIHVKGHSDDTVAFSQLTIVQQLNVRCDQMAKSYLLRAIRNNTFIQPHFPGEDISLSINSAKVRSSTRKAIYSHWGKQVAQDLFSRRDKVPRSSFGLICWEIIPKVMQGFPKTFQDWITRHISDFNGCNRYLSRWKPTVKNFCPSCGVANEDTRHITRCRDPTRTALYQEGVIEIRDWLSSNHTPPHLTFLLCSYLYNRGEATMESLLPTFSPYLTLAQAQDLIGFDNILVGRLPTQLITIMTPILASLNHRSFTCNKWAKELSRQLLLFTHRQWTYRNCTVHYKPSEGKTVAEHTLVDEQVRSLRQLPPSSLLPHHRHLLTLENFTLLLQGSTTAKQFWIAEVQASLAEAALVRRLKRVKYRRGTIKRRRHNKITLVTTLLSNLIPPAIATEKGLKWKKRRQK